MSSGISSTPSQAGHGAPFCSFTTVFNNYFLPGELPDKMDTSPEEQATYSIKTGDILLTRTSETLDELGMSCVAAKDYPKATYSGFLKRLRPLHSGITYHKFMAFYLRSPLFRKAMNNNAVMTLRCSLNEQIFSYLDLLLPSHQEQIQIGDLLYSIHAKIELNHRINQELEGLAKLLYDYWFVQFDFPISAEQAAAMGDPTLQGKPYRQSGGKMTYNPTLKREIPEGWDVGNLEELCLMVRGVTYSKADIRTSTDSNTIPILRATNVNNGIVDLSDLVYVTDNMPSEDQYLDKFDILVVMSSGSKEHVGKNALYCYNQQVAFGAFCSKVVPNSSSRFFVAVHMQSHPFKKYITNVCRGTSINNLTINPAIKY
ncbi:MAG: restriction endonuclease subunit S [Luteolibacter sp.]